MAAGPTSLLAFWLGGAGADPAPPAQAGGIVSMLAPWLGGAGTVQAGFYGLLGLWIGGAAPGAFIAPPIIPEPPSAGPVGGGGGGLANQRSLDRRRAEITQQNHAVLAAIMAFVCSTDD